MFIPLFYYIQNISVKHSDDHLQLTLQINDYKSWLVFDENPLERRSLLIGFIRIWILKPINSYVVPSWFPSTFLGPFFLPCIEEGPPRVSLNVITRVSVDSRFFLGTSFMTLNFQCFIDLSMIKVIFNIMIFKKEKIPKERSD